jgi:hypothetical protein
MRKLALIAVAVLAVSTAPFAQQNEEVLTIDDYVEMARPNMHHSCRSAWEAVEGDETALLEMIGPMIAISLYNRDVDLVALAESRGGAEPLRAEFYEVLKDAFVSDHDALLAGVIDHAVAEVADAD